MKYFATSATDQLEASGGSPVNVVDNFGRVITASLFDGGDLIYTKILHYKETTITTLQPLYSSAISMC